MRFYETMYIENPSFEDERINKVMELINDELSNNKVKVINHYIWGKKRLEYPIQKHNYGNYVLLHFNNIERQFLLDFEMYLRLNASVLRFQTVRLDEEPSIVEQHEIIVEDDLKASDIKSADLEETAEAETAEEETA